MKNIAFLVMEKLSLWWYYFTDSGFRSYVHSHDLQSFYNDLENRRLEMLDYKRRSELIAEFGEEQGNGIFEQEREIGEHARRYNLKHSINADGSCNLGCC